MFTTSGHISADAASYISLTNKIAILAGKLACKTILKSNLYGEVRLIPELKLFSFWKYGMLLIWIYFITGF